MKTFVALLFAFASVGVHSQALKFTVQQQVNADGSVTPTLTWCTEKTASAGLTCTNPEPASGCTASGAWTGAKAASGTQAFAAVTTMTTYALQCAWPGSSSLKFTWTPPTTRDDGSPLNNLAGYRAFYST